MEALPLTLNPVDRDARETVRGARPELILLVIAGLFVSITRIALVLAQGYSWVALWPIPLWIGCAVFGHLALNRRAPDRDPILFGIVMLLAGWGLNEIDRLLPDFAVRQSVWLVIGVVALTGIIYLPRDLQWLSRYRYLWLGGCLLLFNVILLLGGGSVFINNTLVRLRSNPTELIKLALLIFFASYLADNYEALNRSGRRIAGILFPSLRYLLPLFGVWALSAATSLWQHALGLAILYLIILIFLLYVATGRWLYLIGGALILVVVGVVALIGYSVARERVAIWLDPWSDSGGTAYQIVQSLLAFASGSVFGQGIGQGAPVYIPVVHSDLIFAAIGEEWGLLGALTVLICEAVLCIRALRISIQQAHPFRALLTAGIGLTFGVQSFLIMGGTLKLIPLTGITLPFVSYSGSSLLISFVMVGFLIAISASTPSQFKSLDER